MKRRPALVLLAALGPLLSGRALAQRPGPGVVWKNLVTVYGDNTEFFTPYREGETILGGQFTSAVSVTPAAKFEVRAGVFGDVRWGSGEFLDRTKPILSFRYHSPTSLGVIGTLETSRRHGFLEPLEVTTLELTRPVEYGLQWIERRRHWDAEGYLNWQALNTPTQREVFDFGWHLKVRPVRQVTLEGQFHGLHHGGQLFSAGVPVTNNVASAFGVTVADTVGGLGLASAGIYRLRSNGNIDPAAPAGRPAHGSGTYLRLGVHPLKATEVFAIEWWGKDFLGQDGDNNYNSAGLRGFYRERRRYFELGIARRAVLDGGVQLDAEFRFHRIDDEESIAIQGTKWEYSYRLVIRTPFDFTLR